MADAAALIDLDLRRNAFLQAFDMTDDADHLAAGVEGIKRGQCNFQCVGIKRAKTFIEEERVD